MRKVRKFSIKSLSTLFSCSIRVMYNRFHCDQNERFMLEAYIPGINASILPKKHDENLFSEKLVNKLHAWIENHPHVIHNKNANDSFFVKINGILVKRQKDLPQISVRELHNDMILPIYEGVFFCARKIDGEVCIVDTSLRKCMQEYIKPIRNRNKITCVCKTCISAMLLQSDINKWRLSQLSKIDKLYINSTLTRILQRSNNDFIEYNN